jgi:hypothetical protein
MHSGFETSTGTNNAFFGLNAGDFNSTGSNNTCIGPNADVSLDNLSSASALGVNAISNNSNKIRIGSVTVSVIEGQVDWTFPSDGRFKYNVNDLGISGLDFIEKLRPVTYQFDNKKFEEHLIQNFPDSIKQKRLQEFQFSRESAPVQTGFIAQEIEQACNELNFSFSGLHLPQNETDNYGLAYGSFVPLLVKGMQEQQAQIESQQTQITGYQDRIQSLENTLILLAAEIEDLKKK